MLLSWLLLALAAFSSGLSAEEGKRPSLRTAYVEFPPYTFMDESGQPAGRFIEIASRVADRAGYDLDFQMLPIGRTYLYLQNGKVDLWLGVSGVPALNGHVEESRAMPIRIDLSAWHLPERLPVRSVADLRGHIVILITGYTYGGLLNELTAADSGVVTTFTSTHRSALEMLMKGRGHYLLDYRDPVETVLKQSNFPRLESEVLKEREGAFVFSRRLGGAERIRQDFDQAFFQLYAEGALQVPQQPE